MSYLTFLLVMTSALLHASWNLLAKRAGDSSGFIWLFNGLAAIIYLPIMLFILIENNFSLTLVQVIFLVGSACIHLIYFVFLQRSYGEGDLSLSYPLARGTGPLLSTLGAIIFLNERPSIVACIGIILLLGGMIFIVNNPLQVFKEKSKGRTAIGYALLTGVFIASYTIWDKYAVSVFAVSPLLMSGVSTIVLTALLTPASLKKWHETKETWKRYKLEAIGVAILSPLAYLLILFALIFSPISQIAPLRESSVLIGTFMGTRLLAEKHGWRRIGAAAIILSGIVLLTFGS